MSTFLQIAQKAARDSGVISGLRPTVVTGQTGDLLKIVEFVKEAWRDIQNRHASWRWMRKEFTGTTSASSARYTAASFNLTDHAEWIIDRSGNEYPTTLYLQATGVSDEREIGFIPWATYVRHYLRGSQTNQRPVHFSVSPANEFCLGPVPDDTYVVRGGYRQDTQELAANADTPGMPARFHDLIAHLAVMKFGGHDEASFSYADSKSKADAMMFALERDQLPMMTITARPIA